MSPYFSMTSGLSDTSDSVSRSPVSRSMFTCTMMSWEMEFTIQRMGCMMPIE